MSEDPAVRSRIMAAVRSKNTSTELRLRRALWAAGIKGYRVHITLPGTPDITFTRVRVAVFIDGCFWHRCPQCFRPPKSRPEYWEPKIKRNVERDNTVNHQLSDQGWHVLRFWEHEVNDNLPACVRRVKDSLNSLR